MYYYRSQIHWVFLTKQKKTSQIIPFYSDKTFECVSWVVGSIVLALLKIMLYRYAKVLEYVVGILKRRALKSSCTDFAAMGGVRPR
jgi:hypothetical protein